MRYVVTIADRTFLVEVADGKVLLDGEPIDADLRALPSTPVRHLLVDGRSHPLIVLAGQRRGGWRVGVDGHELAIDVVDERTHAIREMADKEASRQGPKPVRAPMPGIISRIEVEPGQTVGPGQGVVVIEAMKMENELRTDAPGVVSRVLVESGQAVVKGTVLVEFAEEP